MIKKSVLIASIALLINTNSHCFSLRTQDLKNKAQEIIDNGSVKQLVKATKITGPLVAGLCTTAVSCIAINEAITKKIYNVWVPASLIVGAVGLHATYKGGSNVVKLINTNANKLKLQAASSALASFGGVATTGLAAIALYNFNKQDHLPYYPLALAIGATGMYSTYHCLQNSYDSLKNIDNS